MLFDATWMQSVEDLKSLYAELQKPIGRLRAGGKVLILASHPLSVGTAQQAAVFEAMTGFVRSLAKELGAKGVTVNLVELVNEGQLAGVTRFFLSSHSSFISGQVLVVSGGKRGIRFDRLMAERTVLVTGAAQGIGASIARHLAAEGAKVILLDRPQEMPALEALAKDIDGTPLPIDISRAENASVIVKKLWAHAPIHGVVHNAGVTRDKTLRRMSDERWDSVMAVNLSAPIMITDLMLSSEHETLLAKDASVVFLSSIGGIAGNAGQTNYAASKSGLIGYSRFLTAQTLGSQYRFNCVAPGFIETRMTAEMPLAVREVARRFNSLNQGGLPDDVAEAVTFLMSTAASGINGQVLRVCGQNLIGA